MIKDFETLKTQLVELASVINSFKSEAVQLRVVELVLGGTREAEGAAPSEKGSIPEKNRSSRKASAKTPTDERPKPKRKTSRAQGAVATLTRLAEEGFFRTPKTINDIIEHCTKNLAHTFKPNEFSGKLSRMVRNGELTREKNTDKQYEYKKA